MIVKMAETMESDRLRAFSVIYHLLVFTVQTGGLKYNLEYIVIPNSTFTYGGRWKYLTFWCMIIQTVYFGYCLINDIFGSNLEPHHDPKKRSKLQKFRDFAFASWVFPIGVFVVSTFWGLYAIDRELVFPKVLDGVIPMWLNHVMHTTVLPFLLIEKFLVYHHYPARSQGLGAAVALTLAYQLWIFWIALYAGIWVYPVLQVLSWPGRAAFLAVLWVFMMSLYIIGEKLNSFLWQPNSSVHAQKLK